MTRAAAKYPVIINRLREGKISISTAGLLAPHLTSDNHRSLIDKASGKAKREVEMLLVRLAPKPEPREVVRTLSAAGRLGAGGGVEPEATGESLPSAEADRSLGLDAATAVTGPRQRIEPLAADRIRFAFTGTEEFLEKVERCRQLLRHKHPAGRLEDVFAEAIEALLGRKDPDRRRPASRRSSASRPRTTPASRRIPKWVQDQVWRRDGGRCSFRAADGTPCGSQDFLEYDHVIPWALGGTSDHPGNVRLLCRSHNQHAAKAYFGDFGAEAGQRPN